MTEPSYIAFCRHIECEALWQDEESRIIEYCGHCKAYLLIHFLKERDNLPNSNEYGLRAADEVPGNTHVLSVYKRALQLACEDVKNCKRFCPRYYRMWECNRPLCPDLEKEWTCWALAYLDMARNPNKIRD